MNIVNHFTSLLEAMRQDTNSQLKSWQYNSPSRANVENDYSTVPTAVMYCLTDWRVQADIVREMAQVSVGFLTTQPELDFDGMHNETLIDDMKDIALDFIARISSAGVVEITSDTIDIRSIYDGDDRNLTGVFVTLDCKEIQGQCLANYEN